MRNTKDVSNLTFETENLQETILADIISQEQAMELDTIQRLVKDPDIEFSSKLDSVVAAIHQIRENKKNKIKGDFHDYVCVYCTVFD
eukprot:CFRG5989T1